MISFTVQAEKCLSLFPLFLFYHNYAKPNMSEGSFVEYSGFAVYRGHGALH